jgi:hypothetical protein
MKTKSERCRFAKEPVTAVLPRRSRQGRAREGKDAKEAK